MTNLKYAENMNILAFDTTLDKTYIALQKGANALVEPVTTEGPKTPVGQIILDERVIKTDEKNYHSAYLISAIKDIMQKNDLKLQELGLIAVNNGPGSFTGIRVGVTVAKTLSKELGVNVLGVSSLDILQKAYENLFPDVVADARKESFYFKSLGDANTGSKAQKPEECDNISLVPYSEIQNEITKNTVVCDASSYPKLKAAFENRPEINIINFEESNLNLALSLLEIAKDTVDNVTDADLSWHTLNPRYIQPPPIHKK